MFKSTRLAKMISQGALATGLMLAIAGPAAAQQSPLPVASYLLGTVAQINGTLWTVNSQSVNVAGAYIDDRITVGSIVEIRAFATGPNAWLATYVDREDDLNLGAAQWRVGGLVQAVTPTSVTIGGQTYTLPAGISAADLVLGNPAVLTLSVDTSGAIVVTRVRTTTSLRDAIDDRDDDNSISGTATPTGATVTAEQAATIALGVLPNARITEVELYRGGDGRPYWEVKTNTGHEFRISAVDGTIWSIERDEDGDDNSGSGSDDDRNDDNDDDSNDDSFDDNDDDSSDDDSNDDNDDDSNDDNDDDSSDDDSNDDDSGSDDNDD